MLHRTIGIGWVAFLGVTWSVFAQEPAAAPGAAEPAPERSAPSEPAAEADCARCHACDRPTAEDRCLRMACTRGKPWTQAFRLRDYQGPDVVILDELEEAYLPVPFDHRGHAGMADMVGGCVVCHHRTPAGKPHPACKTCHPIAPEQAGIDMPALKGAYHQQCLNCHREWINERDCDACHRLKAVGPEAVAAPTPTTKDDILGRMHPPIPEPEGDTFRAGSQHPAGWQVIFRHRDHVDRFGLKCVECHHESSCARCHNKNGEDAPQRTLTEHHRPCVRCHKRDMDLVAREAGRCEGCHWPQDQPIPKAFDHVSTGWPLGRFHEDKSCRICHKDVPFTKLGRSCADCHKDWTPSTFNHAVTGQALDENHREQDCELCHAGRAFDRPPTCVECHEEDEDGIAFPKKRPGLVTGR